MALSDLVVRRLTVIRVVTASDVVPWHLANTLRRMHRDFDVYVIGQEVSKYRDSYPDVRWKDIRIERKVSLLADLRALFQLCSIFRAIRPDIVHSIMPKAGLLTAIAGFLCRTPVRIHTFTGQTWATKQGFSLWLYRSVDRLVVSLNTLCMTDSPSQSEFLIEHGICHHGDVLPVLRHGSLAGVDLDRFHPHADSRRRIRSELHVPERATVFLYVGRLTRDKGILDLVEAFAMLGDVDAHLVLAGPDEEGLEQKILNRIESCLDRCHLAGFVQYPEAYFAAADIFCLPSYREGFGSVVIEAAACGLPAIGTRIPGVVDAIEEGVTGLLCTAGDSVGLAECMRDLLENQEKARLFGRRAMIRARKHFGADLLYDALNAQYRILLKDHVIRRNA